LERRRHQAIAALLIEPTVAKAAAAAKVGERTLLRWLRESGFAAEYRAARRAVVEHAVGALQRLTERAVGALERNLTCGNPAAEIRAALGVLDRSLAAVELFDLAGEIDRLQERIDAEKREREAANARQQFAPAPPARWGSGPADGAVGPGSAGGMLDGGGTLDGGPDDL
jgi:hypothetical protein